MAHLTVSVEYGLHSLLWMVDSGEAPLSSRDLADFQGISHSFLAKIFPKLEKAGIVRASEGMRGGYVLARPAGEISFLQVVDAIEGHKPLFDCQNIRGRCALFGGEAPRWATSGVCSIHGVMLRAEKAMRDELEACTLAELAQTVAAKAPRGFGDEVGAWISDRLRDRPRKPRATRVANNPEVSR